MDLTIIIVNWNVKNLLKRCLESIFHQTEGLNYEVIVVDNNSADGSQDFLSRIKHQESRIRIILNGDNVGFAKANNQALKIAQGDFIIFLNPDTEIINHAVAEAVKFMRENTDCGLVGPQLVGEGGEIQPSARSLPSFWSQFLILLKIHQFFPNLPPIKKYYRSDFDYQQKQEVDQLAGGFLMTKKEIINKIGGFDERFFLWFEDVDFCYRLKTAGWKIIYNPEIKIKHYGHQSFDQMMPYRKQKIYNQSLMNYFIKYSPRWQFFILLALRPISLFLSFVVQISRPLFKGFYASRQLSKRC